jgi:hypothetical protein
VVSFPLAFLPIKYTRSSSPSFVPHVLPTLARHIAGKTHTNEKVRKRGENSEQCELGERKAADKIRHTAYLVCMYVCVYVCILFSFHYFRSSQYCQETGLATQCSSLLSTTLFLNISRCYTFSASFATGTHRNARRSRREAYAAPVATSPLNYPHNRFYFLLVNPFCKLVQYKEWCLLGCYVVWLL